MRREQVDTRRGLRPKGSPSEGERERRKVGQKSLTCVLSKLSSANGKYSKLQSLPENALSSRNTAALASL